MFSMYIELKQASEQELTQAAEECSRFMEKLGTHYADAKYGTKMAVMEYVLFSKGLTFRQD